MKEREREAQSLAFSLSVRSGKTFCSNPEESSSRDNGEICSQGGTKCKERVHIYDNKIDNTKAMKAEKFENMKYLIKYGSYVSKTGETIETIKPSLASSRSSKKRKKNKKQKGNKIKATSHARFHPSQPPLLRSLPPPPSTPPPPSSSPSNQHHLKQPVRGVHPFPRILEAKLPTVALRRKAEL
ncbi:hypothetical protein V1478_013217 [Vespula squamosa]|uniref:Uncharacterized protein n=1 Tax=Vespula squamosa TaxID=30214 RepID=A0ABD2AAZ3_VESSQ